MVATIVLLGSLALVFALEGAIIGKMLPTTAIFPAYVLMFDVTPLVTGSLIVLSATAATLGQFSVFKLVEKADTTNTYNNRLKTFVYENKWYKKTRRYFRKVTPSALLITNIIPGVRGMLMVPLAETQKHSKKTVVTAAFIGNVIHFTLSAVLVLTGWIAIFG